MVRDEEQSIVLRSYATVWKYEKKVYSIDSLKLWVPLAVNDLLFFVLGLVLMLLVSKIHIFTMIPWIIRYGMIPFLVMKFFTKMKFDGKLPHKFALGYLEYMTLPDYLSRFKACANFKTGRFQDILYRGTEYINIIDERLKESRKGKSRKKRRQRSEV